MMQRIAKLLIGVVLACQLLSCVSGLQRPLHCSHPYNRSSRDHCHALARLRRCRGNNPIHHPVRPCKNAMLPPEDDNVDLKGPHSAGTHERLPALSQDSPIRPFSPLFGSRPLPTEVPRHQTLCILLI
jgi:hypothetical protein